MSWLDVGWHFDIAFLVVLTPVLTAAWIGARSKRREREELRRRRSLAERRYREEAERQRFLVENGGPHLRLVTEEPPRLRLVEGEK